MSTTRTSLAAGRGSRPALRATRSVPTANKRARSPDNEGNTESAKRRALEATPKDAARHDKERRQAERAAKDEEFKLKYTRAFPAFSFHFDAENIDVDHEPLSAKIAHLGASVDDFFSGYITHLITDLPIDAEKENNPKSSRRLLKSPVKLRNRNYDLVKKAQELGNIKIWNSAKLESVLDRCLPSSHASVVSTRSVQPPPHSAASKQLAQLLERERVNGSTERDPTQKRHDFKYFKRGSFFLLVEDLDQKVATIIAKDYPPARNDSAPEWPVLHCHPKSRNPWVPFDAKEKRKWEKTKQAEKDKKKSKEKYEMERQAKLRLRALQEQQQSRKQGDLRRAVSMNNMRRDLVSDDDEPLPDESANASGYFSGNVAASGNSVAITSTIGTTTSTSGHSRAATSALLKGLSSKEVFTSRKASKTLMGPPPIPSKLKKSKSMTMIRQEKRQEGQKPGYCECCRVSFKDFKTHATDRRHRKFARNDANFSHLDLVLDRLRRKPVSETNEDDIWSPVDMDF